MNCQASSNSINHSTSHVASWLRWEGSLGTCSRQQIHQKQPIYYLNFLTYIWCFSLSIQANCSPTHVNSVAKLDVCDELQVVNNPGTYVRVPPIDNFVSTSNGATTFHTFQPNNSRSTSDKNSSKFFYNQTKLYFSFSITWPEGICKALNQEFFSI